MAREAMALPWEVEAMALPVLKLGFGQWRPSADAQESVPKMAPKRRSRTRTIVHITNYFLHCLSEDFSPTDTPLVH